MSYYVTYNENKGEQSIYFYNSIDRILIEAYTGIIGELLINFINIDLSSYHKAYQLVQDKYKVNTGSDNDFNRDIYELEYILGEQPKHLYLKTFPTREIDNFLNLKPKEFLNRLNLRSIQVEFKHALEFCFNLNKDPYLSELNQIQRLYLYTELYDSFIFTSLPMTHLFSGTPPTANSIIQNINSKNLSNDIISFVKSLPLDLRSYTTFNDPQTACYIEFMKLIELGLNVKRCKNCHNYFVTNTGYDIEYCERIAEGETKTCRTVGAVRQYAEKLKKDPILEAYNRAYKTHYARIRSGKMEKKEFEIWASEAAKRRDLAKDGKIKEANLDEMYYKWLRI